MHLNVCSHAGQSFLKLFLVWYLFILLAASVEPNLLLNIMFLHEEQRNIGDIKHV